MVAREDQAADAHSEIELKLAVEPAVLPVLRKAEPLAGIRPATRLLRTTYFDTAAFDLAGRGLALRVRRSGRRFVQALKSDAAGGGIRRRGEWETIVRANRPDLDALRAILPEGMLDGLEPEDLVPAFSTEFRRALYRVAAGAALGGPAVVDIAIDRGQILAAGATEGAEPRTAPICEIEFELVEGAPAALYGAALALHEVGGFRIEPRAKAERGHALAVGAEARSVKAGRFRLEAGTTVDDGLAQIFGDCFRHWTANEAAVLADGAVGGDGEGVHQVRVGLRRLRSAFSTFADVVDPEAFRALEEEARWAIGSMGDARDLDVLLGETMAPVAAARPGDADLGALGAAAEAARAVAYERARAVLTSPRYAGFVLRFGRWLELRGWREHVDAETLGEPMVDLADRLLGKRHRRVLKRGHDFSGLPAEGRHRVRLALKKLRYAAEFFRSLYRKRAVVPFLRDLSALQEDLGRLNDVAVMERRLAALADAVPDDAARTRLRAAGGLVIGWHAHVLAEAEHSIVADWERFAAGRPFWRRSAHRRG